MWDKMGYHAHKVTCILNIRTDRYWKRRVIDLPPAEIVAELEEVCANTHGSIECQRERLWRAVLRIEERYGRPVVRVR